MVVQIESRAGVAAADTIAAVPGVDALFIGPSDLAAGYGHLGNAGTGTANLHVQAHRSGA